MLSPNDRTLYSQSLKAPLGYRFDTGIATTFTLDLETLLVLPYTLATQQDAEPDELLNDPVRLLGAIRETTDRLSVFSHDGYIHSPRSAQPLFGLLEPCIIPVRLAGHGLFHPKVWVLRFSSTDGEPPIIRVVVLSRNLTFDRSWGTAPRRSRHGSGRCRARPGSPPPGTVRSLSACARGLPVKNQPRKGSWTWRPQGNWFGELCAAAVQSRSVSPAVG